MIVVDASIIAPSVLPDEPSWPAGLEDRLAAGPLAVPAHWPAEIANLLHMAERRGRIDRRHRQLALERLRRLPVSIGEGGGDAIWRGSSDLADRHGLTIYDAAYLELAIRLGAALATRDRELVSAAAHHSIELLTY